MATTDHIVDVPLDDNPQKSEAGSVETSKDDVTRDSIKPTNHTPISLKIAVVLWIVCSVFIAVLDYFQSQTTEYIRLALKAVTIGLVLASMIFLTIYAMKWTANRKQQKDSTSSSTPVEVSTVQGLVYV